jgi:signal transduction histidine kinase
MVDQDRIGQVLSNYLTNALKYSATSTPIIVGLVVEEKHARVWVRDRGPGLSPEQQRRIWERFYQAAGMKAHSDAGRGLGLGLHICRALIQRHNGEVGVESTPGYGSTFWFTLPLVGRPEILARSNAKGEHA